MQKKATVLLVEDQSGFRIIFKDALENAGYAVLEAEDGQSGWDLIQTKEPDLVLLDLMLPKLHGFTVLQNIRSHETTKNIPVIVLSVLDDKVSREKGKRLGANGYVVKGPLSVSKILNDVQAILSNKP